MMGRIFAVALLLYALGFALFSVTLPTPLAQPRRTDGVVVPTGGPGRIERGLAVIERGEAKRMLVTGVDPDVRPGELAAANGAPRRLFRCCVDLGHEAVDTRSNADETADWVRRNRYRSVRLVTSNWHMARAAMELRHALGNSVEVVRDPVTANPGFALLFGEYNKYLVRGLVMRLGIDL
ncbi:YdcF family protein [Sphingomonas panni]|uniref:YdcF family protein n=1 Tax=Sphingomonas panni TaxID=237612 RepID=UPI001F5B52D5|nr:YdcF family protein [uncultured Sphingomonas sp.]